MKKGEKIKKVCGNTRYEGLEAELIEEAARQEGISIATLQKRTAFDWLANHPRLGPRFQEALKERKRQIGGGLLDRMREATKKK